MKRILKILIGIELIYLVLANGALQLPLTQDLVNKIRPEKFTVTWERAWTWYPFRVHAEKVFQWPGAHPAMGSHRKLGLRLHLDTAADTEARIPL